VLEDDDQKGLAHFVEHMEFEGTQHFPGSNLVQFLSSLGLSIGPDANAATRYNDTQYTLRVPTDVPGVLDRAMLVLEDWARRHLRSEHRSRTRGRAVGRMSWRERRTADDPARQARRIALRDCPVALAAHRLARHAAKALTRFYRGVSAESHAIDFRDGIDRDATVADPLALLVMNQAHSERPRTFASPSAPANMSPTETTGAAVELTMLRPARNQGRWRRREICDQLSATCSAPASTGAARTRRF
jgi:hypothetical protein